MSNALPQIWSVLGTIWTTFFTGWHIPLLNFSPAIMIFGVASFVVAIKLIGGIFEITPSGVNSRTDDISRQSKYIHRKNKG